MSRPSLPAHCPACGGRMHVEKLRCSACGTEVQGSYSTCPVCALDPESRRLLDLFLEARGNLKAVQRALEVSYPTARQRIDTMFQRLEEARGQPDALGVLAQLRRGEISVEQAEGLLRGGGGPLGGDPSRADRR